MSRWQNVLIKVCRNVTLYCFACRVILDLITQGLIPSLQCLNQFDHQWLMSWQLSLKLSLGLGNACIIHNSCLLVDDHAQVSQESGEAHDIIQEEPCVILEEMAYRLQISIVHFFAFTLSKVFKTLLQHVCINATILSLRSVMNVMQSSTLRIMGHVGY